jgi:hypothetical protein
MLASPAQYDYSHPNYSYDQYVAEEASRFAAAAKVTAAALSTTPEERAQTADHADSGILIWPSMAV